MPSADAADSPRIVVDESSFDFRGLSDSQIQQHLDDLNEALATLRRQHPNGVARAPMWEYVECLDGCELYQFLCREHPSGVDRDTLVLSHTLLDRCREWDDGISGGIDTTVMIDGEPGVTALSVGYALAMTRVGRGVACMVFPGITRNGHLVVRGEKDETMVFFFHNPVTLCAFWRSLFELENVPEHGFFELAESAFPRLVLHSGLSFGRFTGSYRLLRDCVVTILSELNDHFADEHAKSTGVPREIEAAMGSHGVVVSLESPKTRASDKLMRERDVTHDGTLFRCEWHAKLEPNRNRIHFSEPSEHLAGRVLVGIFVDHLNT